MTESDSSAIEIVRVAPSNLDGLFAMLADVARLDPAGYFMPHPFSRGYLESLCDAKRLDLHYVLTEGDHVRGYGMLRGWDEGFATPSLGIAIHPGARRAGYGLALMTFLHCAAHSRGARRVRLRVNSSNASAIELYLRLGYQFESSDHDTALRVGYKQLDK